MAEGKKMANILEKFSPSLQSGFKFAMKISPGDGQQQTSVYPLINVKYTNDKTITFCLYNLKMYLSNETRVMSWAQK